MAKRFSACLLLVWSSFWPAIAVSQETAASAVDSGEGRWKGPGDRPLPFATEDEVLAFLRTAEVVSREELTGGINRPLTVGLRRAGVEANAIFRLVDHRHDRARIDGRIVPDFHDSYIYECAAWEMSRLLGIDNVPPCTERKLDREPGTMQLWVENAMTETRRRKAGLKPPQQLAWMRQKQTMRLFDALIYNFDRNLGNMLIDARWKLWFIDHTRSFRRSPLIENLDKIIWCERGVFQRLQELDKKTLSRRLKGLITGVQINMVLKRRDKLVDNLQAMIEEKGENAVLWDAARPDEGSPELRQVVIDDDDIPLTSSKVEEVVQ